MHLLVTIAAGRMHAEPAETAFLTEQRLGSHRTTRHSTVLSSEERRTARDPSSGYSTCGEHVNTCARHGSMRKGRRVACDDDSHAPQSRSSGRSEVSCARAWRNLRIPVVNAYASMGPSEARLRSVADGKDPGGASHTSQDAMPGRLRCRVVRSIVATKERVTIAHHLVRSATHGKVRSMGRWCRAVAWSIGRSSMTSSSAALVLTSATIPSATVRVRRCGARSTIRHRSAISSPRRYASFVDRPRTVGTGATATRVP